MSCSNCGYWAFTARGKSKATCNRCGKLHKVTDEGYKPDDNQGTTVRDDRGIS